MTTTKRSVSILHFFSFMLLAIALVWLIFSTSFVAYLAETSPEAALAIAPNNSAILTNMASSKMQNHMRTLNARSEGFSSSFAIPSPNIEQNIETLVKKALRHEPLNAKALRILGQLSQGRKDGAKTFKLMNFAADLSLRESLAIYWLAIYNIQKKQFSKATYYTDILLRTRPQFDKYSLPLLTQIANSDKGARQIERLFATTPPWRQRFFTSLDKLDLQDLRMPLRLLFSLKKSNTPPTIKELGGYLNFLNRKKQYDIAYYSWLQFLPPKQLETAGFLFNGSFKTQPSGLPFDWNLPVRSKAAIDIKSLQDGAGENALSIKFGYGHGAFGTVSQITMLSPGQYLFNGQAMGNFKGSRGLRWSIFCLDESGQRKVGEGPMFLGTKDKWQNFEFSFTIPEDSCHSQQVRLVLDARTISEQLVSGHVWYDELSIMRPAQTK